jgi:hypothetical protein
MTLPVSAVGLGLSAQPHDAPVGGQRSGGRAQPSPFLQLLEEAASRFEAGRTARLVHDPYVAVAAPSPRQSLAEASRRDSLPAWMLQI